MAPQREQSLHKRCKYDEAFKAEALRLAGYRSVSVFKAALAAIEAQLSRLL